MCNGNCNQGRLCDCVPDIDFESELPAPLTSRESLALLVVMLFSAAATCIGAFIIVGCIWQWVAA